MKLSQKQLVTIKDIVVVHLKGHYLGLSLGDKVVRETLEQCIVALASTDLSDDVYDRLVKALLSKEGFHRVAVCLTAPFMNRLRFNVRMAILSLTNIQEVIGLSYDDGSEINTDFSMEDLEKPKAPSIKELLDNPWV